MGESVSAPVASSNVPERRGVVIEQADMYSSVLAPLMEEAEKEESRQKDYTRQGVLLFTLVLFQILTE